MELLLELANLSGLLLDELLQRLAQVVLKLDFLLFELKFDLTGPGCVFVNGLLHALVGGGNFAAHLVDFSVFGPHSCFKTLDVGLKGLDLGFKFLDLVSELTFHSLGLSHLLLMLTLHLANFSRMFLLLLCHLRVKLVVHPPDLVGVFLLDLGQLSLVLLAQLSDCPFALLLQVHFKFIGPDFMLLPKLLHSLLMLLFQASHLSLMILAHLTNTLLMLGL